nr:DUF1643 domain-containing protein [Sporolactobacillus sp. STSJ-5]
MHAWKKDEVVNAVFDDSKKYRYALGCDWDTSKPKVMFVMLNPSIASLEGCDPTVLRCTNFARTWGYGGISIANLFAYISTNPQELTESDDCIGYDCDHYLLKLAQKSEKIILSWGQSFTKPIFWRRVKEVRNLLNGYTLYCLEVTKDGIPRHPLYLRNDLTPKIYTFN